MTPARLQTFLAVVEHGSARAAAHHLSVTESAVSASLAALHREVGVPLLERHGRGLRVTEAGEIFADYARRILGLLDESLAATRHGRNAEQGRLRLGTVTTAGEYLAPGLLASFTRRYPAVEVTLDVGVRDRVFAQLGDAALDVVIGGRPPPRAGRDGGPPPPPPPPPRGVGPPPPPPPPISLFVVAAAGAVPDLSAATW